MQFTIQQNSFSTFAGSVQKPPTLNTRYFGMYDVLESTTSIPKSVRTLPYTVKQDEKDAGSRDRKSGRGGIEIYAFYSFSKRVNHARFVHFVYVESTLRRVRRNVFFSTKCVWSKLKPQVVK